MKKNKTLKLLLFWVTFFVLFIAVVALLSGGKITIDLYSAQVDIDDGGNMTVMESTIINYPSGYRGRFRDIAYGKNHAKNPLTRNLNYYSDVTNLPVSLISAEVYRVEEDDTINITRLADIKYSFNNDHYVDNDGITQPVECVAGAGNMCESIFIDTKEIGGMSDKMLFVYNYTVEGAVTQYSDVSELNWVFFNGLEGKVKAAEVVISFTSAVPKEQIRAYGHGLGNGNIALYDNEVVYQARNVNPEDSFETRVVFPNSAVSNINNKNKIVGELESDIIAYETELANETNLRYTFAIIINIITGLIIVLSVVVVIIVYRKYDKEYVPVFDSPYLRELPFNYSPAEMSYLYHFKQINDEDVTATLLDLVRRGYLKIDAGEENINEKNPDFIIRKLDKNLGELLPHEQHLVYWFVETIGDGNQVSLKQIEKFGAKDYKKAQLFEQLGREFKTKAINTAAKHDFFENVKKSSASMYGVFLAFVLVLILLLSSIFNVSAILNIIIIIVVLVAYLSYVAMIKKRSRNGNEEYAKWRAFKNFLEEFSNMSDYPIPGIIVWEEYLAYATSLKIADKVMEQLEVKLPDSEFASSDATYMSSIYYGSLFHHGFMVGRISGSISTAKINSVSTISSHNSASSSGSGGGFSGGSSFGGGGGGGRSI